MQLFETVFYEELLSTIVCYVVVVITALPCGMFMPAECPLLLYTVI